MRSARVSVDEDEVKTSLLKTSTVTIVDMLDVPAVVDFEDLGDQVNGYLIGEKGKDILIAVMDELPPGRYSKGFIRKKIAELDVSDKDVREMLPYVPGMIKEHGCGVRFTLSKPQTVNVNELCIYYKDDVLKYVVRNRKGEQFEGSIKAGGSSEELSTRYFSNLRGKCIDLNEDSKHSKENISELFYINDQSDEKFKKSLQALFTITSKRKHTWEGNIYAVYKGVQQGKALGSGNFGKVKLCWDLFKEKWCVVKVLQPMKQLERELLKNYYRPEESALKALDKGEGSLVKRTNKDETKYNLVMDYGEGIQLRHYLETHPSLSAIRLLDIALQLIAKTEEIHQQGYLHCDIKLDNFLYDPLTGKITVIDMGFALKMENKTAYAARRGTDFYLAPEIANDESGRIHAYSVKTDTYAVGQVLKEILGFTAWNDNNINYRTTSLFKDDIGLKQRLDGLTKEEARQRTPLSTIQNELTGLHTGLLPLSYKATGILNVTDYMQASKKERQAMIAAMLAVDVVYLGDYENNSTLKNPILEYSKIRRDLIRQGICVGKQVVVSNDTGDVVNLIHKDNAKDNQTLFSHICYFHTKNKRAMEIEGVQSICVTKSTRDYKTEIRHGATFVSTEHLTFVQGELKKELTRMIGKHVAKSDAKESVEIEIKNDDSDVVSKCKVDKKTEARVKALLNIIDEIDQYKNGRISYAKLFEDLHNWERGTIQHRSKLYKATAGRLFFKPKRMRTIHQIAKKLKEDTRYITMQRMKKLP